MIIRVLSAVFISLFVYGSSLAVEKERSLQTGAGARIVPVAGFPIINRNMPARSQIGDEERGVIKKWDQWLHNYSWYDSSDYLSAITELYNDYASSKQKVFGESLPKQSRQADYEWIDRLISTYGVGRLTDNYDAVQAAVLSLAYESQYNNNRWLREKAAYKEALWKEACRDYIHKFTLFYESLDKNEREQIARQKTLIDSYASELERTAVAAAAASDLKVRMLIYGNLARRWAPDVYNYLKDRIGAGTVFAEMDAVRNLKEKLGMK